MIVHEVEQGTPEWHRLRVIPTASQFHRILTPGTLKSSSQAAKYRHELAGAWAIGGPVDAVSTDYMDRGHALEAEAGKWYQFDQDATIERVGFVTTDDGLIGCSPDYLVGEHGILGIKCPGLTQHIAWLEGEKPTKYRLQTQGELMITGREWFDFLSYHPSLPPVLVRFERDEDAIEALGAALEQFNVQLIALRNHLEALGHKPPEPEPADEDGPEWRWDPTRDATPIPAPDPEAAQRARDERAAVLEETRAAIEQGAEEGRQRREQ